MEIMFFFINESWDWMASDVLVVAALAAAFDRTCIASSLDMSTSPMGDLPSSCRGHGEPIFGFGDLDVYNCVLRYWLCSGVWFASIKKIPKVAHVKG